MKKIAREWLAGDRANHEMDILCELILSDDGSDGQTLREQVKEFHYVVTGEPFRAVPGIVPDEVVRLRAALVAEEFFETIQALFSVGWSRSELERMKKNLLDSINGVTPRAAFTVNVDLPELADGLADLDYVVEGTRLAFGIDGAPIAAAVHAANMAKAGGPISPNGKRLKPPGWTPPDVEGELKKQGWKP